MEVGPWTSAQRSLSTWKRGWVLICVFSDVFLLMHYHPHPPPPLPNIARVRHYNKCCQQVVLFATCLHGIGFHSISRAPVLTSFSTDATWNKKCALKKVSLRLCMYLHFQDVFILNTPGGGGWGKQEEVTSEKRDRNQTVYRVSGSLNDYRQAQNSAWCLVAIVDSCLFMT